MKKVISLLLVTVMVASLLVGCGGGKEKAAVSESGAIMLNMWVHQTEEAKEGKLYADLVKEFNEAHQGEIEVTLTGIARSGDAGGYDDKINAAITNNDMPDVFTVDGPTVAANADAGVILPIGAFFEENDLEDYNKSVIEQGTYKEQLYALGTSDSSVFLYYNKDMFEAAGVTPAAVDSPWTWDEFYEACKKLTTESVFGATLGLHDKGEWFTYAYLPMVQSGGGNIISQDGEETVEGYMNGQATIDAVTFIQKLVNEKVVSATPEDFTFEKGSAAICLSGPWEAATLADYDINWGTMPYPIKEQGAPAASPCGTWTFAMSKGCTDEKQAAAAELIKFLTTSESAVRMYGANSMPPARQSAYTQIEDFQKAPMDVINYQLANNAAARPSAVNYPILSTQFANAVANVANGMEVKAALDEAVEQYNFQVGK